MLFQILRKIKILIIGFLHSLLNSKQPRQHHQTLQQTLCAEFQILGTKNFDTHPSLRKMESYPKFQSELADYQNELVKDFKSNSSYTSYKFGDGDYYFLKGIGIGSAAPGKRAVSRKLSKEELKPFQVGATLCDKYFCEIYPENREKFSEIMGKEKKFIPAEFNYGLIANRWIFEQFGGSIGIIGASEKIELIRELLTDSIYQEYLGMEKFTDYISIPQKFACDDLQQLEKSLESQLYNSTAKIFIFGIGHVKSGIAHKLTKIKSAIYLDVGSGVDAIAGVIDAKRPYFGDWVNHRIPRSFDYTKLDLLQLEESKLRILD